MATVSETMDISVETLIVAVFAVLPGFVSAAVGAVIAPDGRTSAGEWIASSIVGSLAINAVAFSVFIAIRSTINLDGEISTLQSQFLRITGWTVIEYLIAVYVIAVVWGIVSGLGTSNGPRSLAYRLRLTPVSPAQNVFNDLLGDLVGTKQNRKLRGKPEQLRPWLRLRRDNSEILGCLTNGSVAFGVDEPIEVFLCPAFIRQSEAAPRSVKGLYLRVVPEDLVEVFVARADWNQALPAEVKSTHESVAAAASHPQEQRR